MVNSFVNLDSKLWLTHLLKSILNLMVNNNLYLFFFKKLKAIIMDYLQYMYYELMKLLYLFSLKLKSEIEKIKFFFLKKKKC